MKILPFIISTVITSGLVVVLNSTMVLPAALGKLLSPQHGIWQNAESAHEDFAADLKFPQLKGKAEVYFDDQLIPHVFAENDEDLSFIQGYLHAKFRLFQMDLQTKAAEGRASEIAGSKAINYDKEQRRLGMRYAAENSLIEMEKDPESKSLYDAYTNGINAYISTLTEANTPIEYKILDMQPEKWSNIRTALLLKMMAKMLSSGTENDLEKTNAKSILLPDDLKALYPEVSDSTEPMIPKGTVFEKPGIIPVKPTNADSLYFGNTSSIAAKEISKPDVNNGSNNWAVAGSKTKSGSPILCNDPHLELSLPSIWYEMQLSTPGFNAYGATLPGSPFVIIGFNDSIAWGVTNAQRDVKDYYEIKFKDKTKKEYWFDSQWVATKIRYEEIKVRGGNTVIDTVAYTAFGPVMFDESFSNSNSNKRNLAVRWMAHEGSNEGKTLYLLNRAHNYIDYENAIKFFECPGQNFIFSSKSGDIALWQQGKFPARWEGQGIYIMPGEDSSYMWQGYIPQIENPHALNPERGFLTSANQRPVDSTYPYFIPGQWLIPRSIAITHFLSDTTKRFSPDDMMKLQNNYFNVTAEDVLPILFKYVKEEMLTVQEKKYLSELKQWDLMASANSKGQTIYERWWETLQHSIWDDELGKTKSETPFPIEQTTLELLKKDSAVKYIDNVNTVPAETLFDQVTAALKEASIGLVKDEAAGGIEWMKINKPAIYHLLKANLLPFAREHLSVGGYGNIINATYGSHGPSWRMVVSLTPQTEAYGVYPGGQSGNPGSKFYDNFVDQWAAGKYHPLWMMTKNEVSDTRVKWKMVFSKS
ncbi:penicillin acylase family protein [Ferruginibacter sp. SUN002]|uniref:penicillin acylase family protein n=1 Tax=Ferruginibacter sp. SUN002 TaxID=2937789 RepID=UPI003D35A3D8